MSDSGLVLEHLNVYYGALHAVKDVSLQLPSGHILALLGASGSGKSSLLRAIAGLEPASGRIIFGGEDVSRLPVHRRGLGLMFQDGQLFGHRNVGRNVAYGLKGKLERSKWDERVRELLNMVGLPGYESRAVSTLSGGQSQRVALARALAPAPRLLLLDEPLSALDRALREQLAVEVREIVHTTGTTAVYVTHDQDEAFTVADTVAVMEQGEIARMGSPAEVWMDPQTYQVAQFLGYGPFLDDKQAAQLGASIDADELLACGPEAWSLAGEDQAHAHWVQAQVEEERIVRGGRELTLTFPQWMPANGSQNRGGLKARVDVPMDVEVARSQMKLALDLTQCAAVRKTIASDMDTTGTDALVNSAS